MFTVRLEIFNLLLYLKPNIFLVLNYNKTSYKLNYPSFEMLTSFINYKHKVCLKKSFLKFEP